MSGKATGKLVVVFAVLLLFVYFLYPTIEFNYLLSPQEKEQLRISDPQRYKQLVEKSIKLGLDLQGGMHVVLEVDVEELLRALAQNKDDRFEKALKETAAEAARTDANLVDIFAERIRAEGSDLARYYGSRTLRTHDEIRAYLHQQVKEAVERALEVIRNRVDEFGVAEPTIQREGDYRIVVELAGITDPERVRALLGKTALLEFRMLKDAEIVQSVAEKINAYLTGESTGADTSAEHAGEGREKAPADTGAISAEELFGGTKDTTQKAMAQTDTTKAEKLFMGEPLLFRHPRDPQVLLIRKEQEARFRKALQDPRVQDIINKEAGDAEFLLGKSHPQDNAIPVYLVNKRPELTGETIVDARPAPGSAYDPESFGKWEVNLEFNDEGARAFSRITGANIGKRMAIVLDRRVYIAPRIQAKIREGRARITGLDDADEAKDVAVVLKAGALPAPLKVLEERTVGPSLGRDSIRRGTLSAIIGLIIVALFMMIYYKFSGFVADIALLLNLIILLGIMSSFHATLTLPGIAGIILTIGMAVDANVLIFERVREELAKGKTIWASLDEGYSRALSAIVDANITTFWAGVVLYNFGSGPIRGFALTLMIGIAASMFTAIFVTRAIFEFVLSRKIVKQLSI